MSVDRILARARGGRVLHWWDSPRNAKSALSLCNVPQWRPLTSLLVNLWPWDPDRPVCAECARRKAALAGEGTPINDKE